MNITFEAIGLTFQAEVSYTPGRPGVHTLPNGDPGYPDEPPEMTINRLWESSSESGCPWLLDSDVADDIITAALEACEEEAEESADDHRIAEFEMQRAERGGRWA